MSLYSRLAAAFALLLSSAFLARAEGPECDEPAYQVVVDTSDDPERAEWSAKAKTLCETWMPKIAEQLASPGFTPPKSVRLIFKKKVQFIASASGDAITFSGEYLKANPDDFGMVIHELTHIIQPVSGREPRLARRGDRRSRPDR